jgi:act minimal PKS acyl carrier protein
MTLDGPITLTELVAVLRDCAGEDEDVDLDGDIADRSFTDLGYDSIALLETAARMADRFGLHLDNATVTGLETPAELLRHLNQALAGSGEACG